MINAKDELLEKLDEIDKTIDDIEYAKINFRPIGTPKDMDFRKGSNEFDITQFDFEYNEDYGRQYLFGYIVFEDGSWLERDEYDGLEDWVYREVPEYDGKY